MTQSWEWLGHLIEVETTGKVKLLIAPHTVLNAEYSTNPECNTVQIQWSTGDSDYATGYISRQLFERTFQIHR